MRSHASTNHLTELLRRILSHSAVLLEPFHKTKGGRENRLCRIEQAKPLFAVILGLQASLELLAASLRADVDGLVVCPAGGLNVCAAFCRSECLSGESCWSQPSSSLTNRLF